MRYHRIVALVSSEVAEIGAALLGAEGLALEVLDQTTIERPPRGRVGLVVYAEEGDPQAAQEVAAVLARAGIVVELNSTLSDEADWRDSWKKYFQPRRVGRFWIAPTWQPASPVEGERVVTLDPGRAFGTGGHASTRLCLAALSRLCGERVVQSFLDVGCGSGLLAIAAALAWPEARGRAIDVDPEAIEVTRDNTQQNGVASRILADTTPLDRLEGTFDLVLANISAETLIALAPRLRSCTRETLVLSGVLTEQADRVVSRFVTEGLILVQRDIEEEWCALTLTLGVP